MSSDDKIVHLADHREQPIGSTTEEFQRVVELVVAKQFQEQNEIIRTQNAALKGVNDQLIHQVSRLTNGIERLLGEIDAVRTGRQDQAFARIARHDEIADLPTMEAEVALHYPLTSGEVGQVLGFAPAQIGHLLGVNGLRWAENGDYQEMSRWKRGRMRYWHKDVPDKLKELLATKTPDDFKISNKNI
ncbi:hypothetical protein GGE65_005421 [Skermanella aerolata]|uniref:hypothetical protein n=1 Tax=Skermanella aerolata TaxID=393310 RepID=UPI003D1A082A